MAIVHLRVCGKAGVNQIRRCRFILTRRLISCWIGIWNSAIGFRHDERTAQSADCSELEVVDEYTSKCLGENEIKMLEAGLPRQDLGKMVSSFHRVEYHYYLTSSKLREQPLHLWVNRYQAR